MENTNIPWIHGTQLPMNTLHTATRVNFLKQKNQMSSLPSGGFHLTKNEDLPPCDCQEGAASADLC